MSAIMKATSGAMDVIDREITRGFNASSTVWLIWVGVGSAFVLHSYHAPFVVSQTVQLAFFAVWAARLVDFPTVLKQFFNAVIDLFFRDVVYHGLSNVPKEGVPTILVCAPHAVSSLPVLGPFPT